MNDCVQCQLRGAVALVTINRPQALNALNVQVLELLDDTMVRLHQNPAVKVVILTGAGEKAFVAGADIGAMSQLIPQQALEFAALGHRTMDRIASLRPVTIAAINGFALGGGCELALACDIRIASTNVRMGIPEVTLGVIPGFGGTQRLPRVVGLSMALELLATGRQCRSQECLGIGLVSRVTAPEALLTTCAELADTIALNSGSAISFGKRCMVVGLEMDLGHALELERQSFALTFSTPDQQEGMAAFLEKRPPLFQSCSEEPSA